MQEVWKAISGFESLYEVSNLGRVRSLERWVSIRRDGSARRLLQAKIKCFAKNLQGYRSVHLYISQKMSKFYVHRLVAMAFIDNPLNLAQVNHKDGDKNNNSVENLEWCSAIQNCAHAREAGLYKAACGESLSRTLKDSDIVEIRRQAAAGIFHKDIAEQFGVGRKNITKIVNRQRWAHVA